VPRGTISEKESRIMARLMTMPEIRFEMFISFEAYVGFLK
jgi:hypothetical protein